MSVRFILFIMVCVVGFISNLYASAPFRVMCYNVENLFDCENDSLTNDDDFTPQGAYYWTPSKFRQKTAKIAKVIVAAGQFSPPAIIGLCEIENDNVLDQLTKKSPLKKLGYQYVHFDSPDKRGVDVAMLYLPKYFKALNAKAIPVKFSKHPHATTRDILYVSGVALPSDTLHLFVCHFPSRLGGALESEERRLEAASILRQAVDSLFQQYPAPNILIMGDFNDYPKDKSMEKVLGAIKPTTPVFQHQLYNLSYLLHEKNDIGTHKHGAEWGVLDQFIVSGSLLITNAPFYTQPSNSTIFMDSFLLQEDAKYFGVKPFRTFLGMRYLGGFSDHLPILIDFYKNTNTTMLE